MERIAAATRMAMADPRLQESYRSQGLEPDVDLGPDKFQRLVEDELLVSLLSSSRSRSSGTEIALGCARPDLARCARNVVDFFR